MDTYLPHPESSHLQEINLNPPEGENQTSANRTMSFDLNNSVNRHIMVTNEQRQSIFEALLKKSANGMFRRGESTAREVAYMFGVCPRTVQCIWKQDEKWFNLTKKHESYYLHPLEEDPLRTCKSTNFIPKVMFLTAIARPRIDSQGNCLFDGKIGTFPLIIYEAARRSSVNRPAGTLEMKPISSIKKDVIRNFLIEKVLPTIRAKWPREDILSPIYIQQDNAPTHIDPNDPLFCEAANKKGFDIRLISQPPNFPDLNVLDLGFFRAIQSIQHTKGPRNFGELVSVVEESFNEYLPHLSN